MWENLYNSQQSGPFLSTDRLRTCNCVLKLAVYNRSEDGEHLDRGQGPLVSGNTEVLTRDSRQ